ncbi:nicotinamide N-methyltransferase-like [Pelobates fuscus]|uniref:nicotinamide N-methyltransferase-like n=1 Tax=Pelobates fuscus TaxID=191477 RepID=UPI002FE4E64E
MEGRKHKHYHDEEFDHHLLIDTYAGRDKTDTKEELVKIPMQKIFQFLSSGIVKGETLIDLTLGAAFCHLMVLADFFKEITILDSSDKALEETEKWLNKDPGAVDWSEAAEMSCELKGLSLPVTTQTLNKVETGQTHEVDVKFARGGQEERKNVFSSELLEAEEDKVRRIVKRCLKWDPTNDNPLGSIVLPLADCAISAWYFDITCKDHASYLNNFRKFSSLLKVGGHLILFGFFDATYITIGDHRFSFLNYNEDFLKEALRDNGYTTLIFDVYESKLSTHLIDHAHIGYIVARKEREN